MLHQLKSPKIVVLGGLNMNLMVVVSSLPNPGETVVGQQYYTSCGGKGGNQAVAAARLGADVQMIGRVGDDFFGTEMLQTLSGFGVNIDGVCVDPDNPTGVATIILDGFRQNYIMAVYGANNECDDDQLRLAKKALKNSDTLMLQLEIPIKISLLAAQYAKRSGVRVILDPAPAKDLPESMYRLVDVLTPNQIEASFLTGVDVTDFSSARVAAEILLQRGVPAVVIKLGELGAIYVSSNEYVETSGCSVEPLDTVGAGDAFGAGLSVGLAEGLNATRLIGFASAAGALAVTKAGAQDSMPSRQEVDSLVISSLHKDEI